MGYVARDVDSGDKRAKEIRLTERGIQLATDNLAVVTEVREYYAQKIGTAELEQLESSLRRAVRKLELDYLPDAWMEQR